MLFSSLLSTAVLATDTVDVFFGNNPHDESIQYNVGAHSMVKPMDLHIVWYGKNWKRAQKDIITDFLSGLGKSEAWKIPHSYYNTNVNGTDKVFVTNQIKVGKQVNDYGSFGSYINNATYLKANPTVAHSNDIPYIINNFIKAGKLPNDTNALYLVLTDDQTLEGQFCKSYCGYHGSVLTEQFYTTNGAKPGVMDPSFANFKYAWIGNANACGPFWPYACGTRNLQKSPNGDVGIDLMLSPLYHEIAEASSNPDPSYELSAWRSPVDGNENGDNCAYIFGSGVIRKDGIYVNQHWNERDYFIQQMWDPNTQFCGPIATSKVPKAECAALQQLVPHANLGPDCCNSGFAGCSNGHIDALEIGSNQVNGTIADTIKFIRANFPRLTIADLSYNNLVGEIPNDVCKMTNLEVISFSGNKGIVGSIPECIGNLKNLQKLTFGNSGISGPIPKSVVKLQELRQFSVYNTAVNGTLPVGFGNLDNLVYLTLANAKNLAGEFPSGFKGFHGLTVEPMDVVACNAAGSGLCIPANHVGPTCELPAC
ncbi:hypothetical protein HDV06_002806 [Boothiomyces sp. JEL0866]|nr:hypothetical protein HDV06_002806 [Boothiomyces sp. JEL0866]